jgi:hypothetical protein
VRRASRRLLIIGLVAAPVVFAAMTVLLLRPPEGGETPIASMGALGATPTFLLIKDLGGLDTLVHRRREQQGIQMMGRAPLGPDLPVWILRVGDDVRAFIARDPRNGCPLRLYQPDSSAPHAAVPMDALFHDRCHGSL